VSGLGVGTGAQVANVLRSARNPGRSEYGELARVRSRRSGRVVFIELALRFDPGLRIAEVNRRIDALKQSLSREIEHADISILALAAPD
jgi:divalent metal cation (Fe/Co/Zn/Cd) transporter